MFSFVDIDIEMQGKRVTLLRVLSNTHNADWVKANSRELFLVMLLWFRKSFAEIDTLTMALLMQGKNNPRVFFERVMGELVSKDVFKPQAWRIDDRYDVNYLIVLLKEINSDALASMIPVTKADRAQLASVLNRNGGIDLGSVPMNVRVNGDDGQRIKLHVDPAMLAGLRSAEGFVPVVISITPVGNLKAFLMNA